MSTIEKAVREIRHKLEVVQQCIALCIVAADCFGWKNIVVEKKVNKVMRKIHS